MFSGRHVVKADSMPTAEIPRPRQTFQDVNMEKEPRSLITPGMSKVVPGDPMCLGLVEQVTLLFRPCTETAGGILDFGEIGTSP